jgi:DNA-binding MarR family transcriptional regulator
MDLQSFLPYRLAVLTESVSRGIAQVYARRFDLSREEWRVLAALGQAGRMKTQAALLTTTLDKMQVSRAVSRLERKGFVEREPDAEDRRNRVLRLTTAGRAAYRRIEPMVLAREAFLLEALDEDERAALDRALDKLVERARQLERQG